MNIIKRILFTAILAMIAPCLTELHYVSQYVATWCDRWTWWWWYSY